MLLGFARPRTEPNTVIGSKTRHSLVITGPAQSAAVIGTLGIF
jgi:hypothetical protein